MPQFREKRLKITPKKAKFLRYSKFHLEIFKSLLIIFFSIFLFAHCTKENTEYIYNKGQIFGTYYSITYLHPKNEDLQAEIEKKFNDFDNSLSTFNPNSIISRINQNDSTVKTDVYFDQMYETALAVSQISNGAFDITVAPLVNAWGFGFGNHNHSIIPDPDTIMPYIGYKKIKLADSRITKADQRIMLDASAIAKGQSCDVIANLLEENGCENFMVEVGGEISCKGLNPKGEKWHIGIDKPYDDPANENQELQIILAISDVSLATSGNYRQFYLKDGKKHSHVIDPRLGAPVRHNLLSATVIASNCMQADAYATAFMVLGVDSAMEICSRFPEMECYLIYSDEENENKTVYTEGFKRYFSE